LPKYEIPMQKENYFYMWRCAKCFYHFANISQVEGILKEQKKCPKCKSLNTLTLTSKEITINCKFYDPNVNGYTDEISTAYNCEVREDF